MGVFLSVPYLVDFYAKNADEWGRNFVRERTLPSLLVVLLIFAPINVNKLRPNCTNFPSFVPLL